MLVKGVDKMLLFGGGRGGMSADKKWFWQHWKQRWLLTFLIYPKQC